MDRFLVDLGVPASWAAALQLGLLGRLVLAAVLGGLVGLERELAGKPAGLRTNLLICVGSALFTDLSIGMAALGGGPGLPADPARVAAQVVTGIGFLGAGTILRSHGRITGLTTAATIWVVAAVGMAVGARAYVPAAGTTVLVMFSLVILRRLERFAAPRRRVTRRYEVEVDPDPELLERVAEGFRAAGMRVRTEGVEKRGGRLGATLRVSGPARAQERAAGDLLGDPRVHSVSRAG